MKLEFSLQIFGKIAQISNLMKICALGAELIHEGERTDRQTDMTEVIVALRNFSNTPKNSNIKKEFIQLWTCMYVCVYIYRGCQKNV